MVDNPGTHWSKMSRSLCPLVALFWTAVLLGPIPTQGTAQDSTHTLISLFESLQLQITELQRKVDQGFSGSCKGTNTMSTSLSGLVEFSQLYYLLTEDISISFIPFPFKECLVRWIFWNFFQTKDALVFEDKAHQLLGHCFGQWNFKMCFLTYESSIIVNYSC